MFYLQLNADGKVIVFLSSRDSVDFLHGIMERLFDQLADGKFRAGQLHCRFGLTLLLDVGLLFSTFASLFLIISPDSSLW